MKSFVVQVCPGFYPSSWLWNKENHVELLFWRFRSRTTRFFSWLWRSVGLWAPLEIHRYVRHEIICLTILENTYVIRTDLNLYTSSIVLRYYPVWNMGNNYWFFFIRFNILCSICVCFSKLDCKSADLFCFFLLGRYFLKGYIL